jgi:hypothetical protein
MFWQVSAADPLTISALLLDRMLQVATIVVLPVATLLLLTAAWPVASVAAATAGGVSLVLGASTGLPALRPPADIFPTLMALAATLAGAILLVWTLREKFDTSSWKLSLLAPLALLPALQFWHSTSFVPGQLTTSVTLEPSATVQRSDGGFLRGVIEVRIRNDGAIGALVLASEVITCFRPESVDLKKINYDVDKLYSDPDCRTDLIVSNLSEVGAKSTFTSHLSFITSKKKPLAQTVSMLWFVRTDRMRVDTAKPESGDKKGCRGTVESHAIKDEARFKGVVQRDRVLVYDDDSSGIGDRYYQLVTKGEPVCHPSRWDIAQYLGEMYIRVNREDWLRTSDAGK